MNYLLFLYFLLSFNLFAQRQKLDPISFGGAKLAEDRMVIDLNSFRIINKGKNQIFARMIPDSLQWIRLDNTLLIPRALIEVSFQDPSKHKYVWEYAHQKIIPLYDSTTESYKAQIFISLFESLPLKLYEGKNVINTITIYPKKTKESHLIDYSCSPYDLEIDGVTDDFISVGCKIQRTGKFGNEKPYLEVLLTSASYRLKDLSEPPYMIVFHESGSAKVVMINEQEKEETITISAKIPKSLPRLRTAFGLGPYTLETRSKTGEAKAEIAPTVMLYGNLGLNDSTSIRFFDSFSKNISTFHNWGVYFAWDLAEFCDQRCLVTSLIGSQGLEYRYSSQFSSKSETIYPQGFEFIYKHPFGQKNYKFSYGMFTSFSPDYDYQNYWIRYGKRYFWELNFIEWRKSDVKASMFGISVGFPLASFF